MARLYLNTFLFILVVEKEELRSFTELLVTPLYQDVSDPTVTYHYLHVISQSNLLLSYLEIIRVFRPKGSPTLFTLIVLF